MASVWVFMKTFLEELFFWGLWGKFSSPLKDTSEVWCQGYDRVQGGKVSHVRHQWAPHHPTQELSAPGLLAVWSYSPLCSRPPAAQSWRYPVIPCAIGTSPVIPGADLWNLWVTQFEKLCSKELATSREVWLNYALHFMFIFSKIFLQYPFHGKHFQYSSLNHLSFLCPLVLFCPVLEERVKCVELTHVKLRQWWHTLVPGSTYQQWYFFPLNTILSVT
jgi:hypothetical protein